MKIRSALFHILSTGLILVLVLVPVSVTAAALSSSSRVGLTGVGPIVIGTTPAQASATGTQFTATKPALGSTCFYLRPKSLTGLSFMIEEGTIRRAEVTTKAIRTTDNFRVGDPVSQLQAFYGTRVSVAPDKYDPNAQTMTVVPKGAADSKYRFIFKVKKAPYRRFL